MDIVQMSRLARASWLYGVRHPSFNKKPLNSKQNDNAHADKINSALDGDKVEAVTLVKRPNAAAICQQFN